MINNNNLVAEKLIRHIGHNIVCVFYGDREHPSDICIECEDCSEVLISAEDYEYNEEEDEDV